MYYLMNKDNIAATFTFETRSRIDADNYARIESVIGTLPYGFNNINSWLENRKSSKHNAHLKKL